MVRRSLHILFFIFFVQALQAQQGVLKFYSDQRVYIAGESIWLAGMKTGDTNNRSVRAYLLDRVGNVIEKAGVIPAGGNATLKIQLDADLVSDNYLVAITCYGYRSCFIPLTVINPVIPPKPSALSSALEYKVRSLASPGFKVNGAEFSKKETVKMTIDKQDKMSYHVNVVRVDDLSRFVDSMLSGWRDPGLSLAETEDESEAKVLKVSVTDASGKPAARVRVFASVLGDQANIGTAVSDKEGKALITLPFFYGNASLVFSAEGGNYRVTYEEPVIRVKGSIGLPPLVLEERFRSSINQRLINVEVTNKYRPELKTVFVTSSMDTMDFYGKPDKRYMLDDYTRIPNMEEILYEYVQEARARKIGEKSVIYVFNTPFKDFFDLPAMVLLDGVPVQDIGQLLAMDPLKLKSVEVVSRKFFFNDLQIPGIVHYKSYGSDMAGFKLPSTDIVQIIPGLSIPTIPAFAPFGKDPSDRVPDMRNLAYWSAFSNKTEWSFLAPDSEGEYLITVYGVDPQGNETRSEMVVKMK